MEELVSVTLSGPAKVAGRWRRSGDVVEVSHTILRDLRAAGAVDGDDAMVADLASGLPGFDQAVAAQAQLVAEAIVDAAVGAALSEVVSERDNAIARASNAEATIGRQDTRIYELEARISELEEQIAAAAPPPGDGDPASQAAKPAPKSGAAKKG